MIQPRGSRIIKVDVYDVHILLLLNMTQIKSCIKLNNLKDDVFPTFGSDGFYAQLTRADDGVLSFIMGITNHDLGILVHECVHMAHCIMSTHYVPISYENTEAEAYLVGHLFDSARKHIKEKK